jgi:DNA-binding GntR family transcriptional regulator
LSLENIKELYAVRSRLEGLMAAAAAKRISEGSLSKLWRIIESLKAQNVTIERFNDLSREFHRIIHISAGNSVCLKLLINISNQIERYRFLSLRLPHRIKPSTDEHERILRYLEKGDYFNAEESMKLHLLNARRLIIENFKL